MYLLSKPQIKLSVMSVCHFWGLGSLFVFATATSPPRPWQRVFGLSLAIIAKKEEQPRNAALKHGEWKTGENRAKQSSFDQLAYP